MVLLSGFNLRFCGPFNALNVVLQRNETKPGKIVSKEFTFEDAPSSPQQPSSDPSESLASGMFTKIFHYLLFSPSCCGTFCFYEVVTIDVIS